MNPPALPDSSLPSATTRSLSLALIGVGGVGGRIVGRPRSAPESWSRWIVDSDVQSLEQTTVGRRCRVGAGVTRGLGCGADIPYAAGLAEASLKDLQPLVQDGGLVVLVAGVGGGVGGGMTPVVARTARAAGALVIAVAVEPFDFETRSRRANADQSLRALTGVCDLVLRVSNQAIARLQTQAEVPELLAAADQHLFEIIEGLEGLLRGPALIPVGFAELERWGRSRRREGIVATARAQGPDRGATLWSRLAQHPLLESGARLKEAGAVLLRVSGGSDLRRDELEQMQRELEAACPQAQLLVGAGAGTEPQSQLDGLLVVMRDPVSPPAGTAPPRGPELNPPASDRAVVFTDAPLGALEVTSEVREGPGRPTVISGRKPEQQQFEFAPVWSGRFENVEGTVYDGENLDEPTFLRRGIKLN